MPTQRYLPVYALESKRILGLIDVGSNTVYAGNETVQALSGSRSVNLQRIQVPASVNTEHRRNTDFMAAVFTHEEVRTEAYRGYPEFRSLDYGNNISPTDAWQSPGGTGAQLNHTDGLVLRGLKDSFAV
jgi:hypothetical protein